jgi:hypothetical protein
MITKKPETFLSSSINAGIFLLPSTQFMAKGKENSRFTASVIKTRNKTFQVKFIRGIPQRLAREREITSSGTKQLLPPLSGKTSLSRRT